MRPFRVEAPEGVLVPVEELRQHVRADTNEEDNLIEAFERSAVDFLDGYTGRLGRCILRQKWALPLDGSSEPVHLSFPDCRDLSIERLDDQGVWSDVAGVTVTQIDDCALIADLPSDKTGLHLTYWAGWDTAADVPANLKQAVRMLVAHWFENRTAVTTGQTAAHQMPMAVEAMIEPLLHVFV